MSNQSIDDIILNKKEEIKQHVTKLCWDVIREKDYKAFNDTVVKVDENLENFAAFITLNERKIHILTGIDIYDAIDNMLKDTKLKYTRNEVLEKIMYFMVVHEYGHHQWCPRTQENFVAILEGSYEAIKGREINEEKIQQLCLYLHNLFSDTILNSINSCVDSNGQKFREGHGLFYLLNYHYNKKRKGVKGDKAFTLFVQSNRLLCNGDIELEKLTKKYYRRFFLGGDRYLKKIVDVFSGDETLTKQILNRQSNSETFYKVTNRMRDSSLWKKMSYDYTNIMYPFLINRNLWLESSYTRKNIEEQEEKGQQGGGGEKGTSRKIIGRTRQQRKAGGGNEKKGGKNGKDDLPSNGSDIFDKIIDSLSPHTPFSSHYLKHFDQLDRLYKERAGRIALFVEKDEREAPHFEKQLSTEEMPLQEFSSRDIDWSSTRIHKKKDGSKEIELFRGSNPLILPFEAKESPGGIPDLAWVFDSSISMEFSPFKNNGEGDYHFAVQSFYSKLNFLEDAGIAGVLNYFLANYSGMTVSSGWRSYSELEIIKKTLFDYQGGCTFLNPKIFEEMRRTRRDNFICFMLTDGGFNERENREQIIKEIELMRESGAGFYLFNILDKERLDAGMISEEELMFAKELKIRGFPVTDIASAEDFMKMSIKFTKDLYGEVIK